MSFVLVDSSVWIEYFRGGNPGVTNQLEDFIDGNRICVNNLILSEILPVLYHKKENELIEIIRSVRSIQVEINWEELIDFQRINLKSGINNVGIPDLIIVQNVIRNNLILYSLDRHFQLMSGKFKYEMV